MTAASAPLVVEVVRGQATEEELAAVIAVLTQRAAASPPDRPATAPSRWAARAAGVRRPLARGWVASFR